MNLIDYILFELEEIAGSNRGFLALVTVCGVVMFLAGFALGCLWRGKTSESP